MKNILTVRIALVAVATAVAIAGCGGDSAAPSIYPAAAKSTISSTLEVPDGDTVTYDDGAVIDGLYNCSLSNTGLNIYAEKSFGTSNPTSTAYVPQFYMSINGKSNGKAQALLVQTSDPAFSSINGSAEVTYAGLSISGATSTGGSVAVNFAFQMDAATGLDNIVGTGTIVMKGKDSSGGAFSNTVNISCNSIGEI